MDSEGLSYEDVQEHLGEIFKIRLTEAIAPLAFNGTLDSDTMVILARDVVQDINAEAVQQFPDKTWVPSLSVQPNDDPSNELGQIILQIHLVLRAGMSLN